jgi:hypothetical protein
MFSFEIGLLVKAPTVQEFERLKATFEPLFHTYCSDPKIREIPQKKLKIIGLRFRDDKIIIDNVNLWNKFSIIERIKYRVPATSGMLESLHGHSNEKLPRKNTFLTALYRIIKSCLCKIQRIDDEVKANIRRQERLSRERIIKEGENQILSESEYYGTTLPDQCKCSEKALPNALFRCEFRCSHLVFKGGLEPIIMAPPFSYKSCIDRLEIRYINISPAVERPMQNIADKRIARISRTIRKYSHSKLNHEIIAFVEQRFENSNSFLMGYPTDTIEIISRGIAMFASGV